MMLRFIITAAVALLVTTASAQSERDSMSAKLLPIGLKGSISGLYFVNEGQPFEFRAAMTGLGTGIDYTGSQVLSLYSSEAEARQVNGESPPTPLASVKLPRGQDRILILVAESGKKISMRAYGVSLDGFRNGDYRFYNLSREKVAVILGDKKLGLEPGEIETVTSREWKNKAADLPIQLGQMTQSKKIRKVYSSVWGHQPRKRNMILVFQGASKAKPLEVRRYYDMAEADNDEEP